MVFCSKLWPFCRYRSSRRFVATSDRSNGRHGRPSATVTRVGDIGQRIGGIRRRLPASEAPERDGVAKLEITLSRRELGLCPDHGLVGGTAIVIEEGAHERIELP